MSTSEISVLVVAALPVLYRCWTGWSTGAAAELRTLLAIFFGMLVAIRFWEPWTKTGSEWFAFDPRWVAAGAFVALFCLGFAVAGLFVNLRGPFYQSVRANYPDKLLGFFAGVFSGSLLGGCVVWIATVAMPGKFDRLEDIKIAQEWPKKIFEFVETNAAQVPPSSPSRTRFPTTTMVKVDFTEAAQPGVLLSKMQGHVSWK